MGHYRNTLENGIVITSTRPEHAEQLEALQLVVFPTLADNQRFKAKHYQKHIEIFSEGQFVALKGSRVVGMTTTIRLDFDFEHGHHSFDEVFCEGWLTAHETNGKWLYGMDIGTLPEFRGLGIARALYHARQERVRELGLLGQVTVGMLSGYAAAKHSHTVKEYFEELRAGKRSDPTISAQRKVGFEIRGLVEDYLDDPVCANCGVLLAMDASVQVLSR